MTAPGNNIKANAVQSTDDAWPYAYSVDGQGPAKMCCIELTANDAYVGHGDECDVLIKCRQQVRAEFDRLQQARKQFREVMDGIKSTGDSTKPECACKEQKGASFKYYYAFFSKSACEKANPACLNFKRAKEVFEVSMREVRSQLEEHASAYLEKINPLYKVDECCDYIGWRKYFMNLDSAMTAEEFERAVDYLLRVDKHKDPSKVSFPKRYDAADKLQSRIREATEMDKGKHERLRKQAMEELKKDPDFEKLPILLIFYMLSLRMNELADAE